MMSRLIFVGLIVAIYHVAQAAENFPVQPVRLVVANPPGGTTDLIARLLAKQLSEQWGQAVIVDNRPGGGGTIGTDLVAKANPNGYTLLISAPAPITANITLFGTLPYDPIKDLAPITLIAVTPSLLLVGPNVPAKSVTELIALAKSKPGKLNYASTGLGNPSHLLGAMFNNITSANIVHIPYKGAGPAVTDLMGGQIEIMFNTIPAMLPLVKSGRVRALAVTTQKRFASLPDVPTMAEIGYPQIISTGWYGAVAPGRTPKHRITKLHEALMATLANPEVKEALMNGGAEIVGNSPEQFSEFIRRETESTRKLIKTSGAKRDQ